MKNTLMVGKVQMEIAAPTNLTVEEFRTNFNEFNIVDAKLVVMLSNGTEATLSVGELLSMNFQAFDPETGEEITDEIEL